MTCAHKTFPKPARGSARLERREKRAARPKPVSAKKRAQQALDRRESAKVRERSGGRCEVCVQVGVVEWAGAYAWRCMQLATQVHHMIGGRGQRGVGISALADHKQHVCDQCHRDITGDIGGKKLIRVGGLMPHWTDWYRRARETAPFVYEKD